MIQVEHLTKYFGPVLAVDNVCFEIDRGEIVGLLGLNGAGKTTTMRILTTYLPATTGTAKVAGFNVRTQALEVRKNIGYLPESVPLYHEMRVSEYLDYRAKIKGVPRHGRQKQVEACMDRCRIRQVARRLIGTLSKGYRQRVGLADALVHQPPILILDEPTVGLDPLQIRETLALIRELGEKRTILFSTHILPEIEAVCSRIIVIHRGRLSSDILMKDLANSGVILMEVQGPEDQVANVLKTTEGVDHVAAEHRGDLVTSFAIRTAGYRDIREVISQRMSRNGWTIRQLDMRRRRVEDFFLGQVSGTDPLESSHRDH
jgi:ABC-2 type transport system ATP-binding protein